MGRRIKKIKKKGKKQQAEQQNHVDLSIEQKNDTIAEIDFFGFSPKLFGQDLKRTGWATAVILLVLTVIFFVTG